MGFDYERQMKGRMKFSKKGNMKERKGDEQREGKKRCCRYECKGWREKQKSERVEEFVKTYVGILDR